MALKSLLNGGNNNQIQIMKTRVIDMAEIAIVKIELASSIRRKYPNKKVMIVEMTIPFSFEKIAITLSCFLNKMILNAQTMPSVMTKAIVPPIELNFGTRIRLSTTSTTAPTR